MYITHIYPSVYTTHSPAGILLLQTLLTTLTNAPSKKHSLLFIVAQNCSTIYFIRMKPMLSTSECMFW